MGDNKQNLFIIIVPIIILLGFVSASYQLGSPSYSIEKEYGSGNVLDGWIKIQFNNESNSTLFEDSEGNSITLIELINENSEFQFEVNSTYGTIDTTEFQKLYFENSSFYLPEEIGNFTYQLNYSGQEIFTEELNILSSEDINATLNSKLESLEKIKKDIKEYDLFPQLVLNSALNIQTIEEELANLSLDYESASSQTEYDEISEKLSKIKIPDSMVETKKGDSIPVFSKEENIDLEVLQTVSGGEYEFDKKTEYINAILLWNLNNLNIKINFKEISGVYSSSQEVLANIFTLEIEKNGEDSYIFIKALENMLFEQDYQESEEGNYYIMDFMSNNKIITFSTTEEIDFSNLDFFISPSLTEIEPTEEIPNVPESNDENNFRWTLFALIMTLLFIVAIIVYISLQVWYKKRYEKYLFKNKNDLYNIATYITNSKKKGLDNKQISDNLKKVGWSYEQIRFALRKYTGKRTGMFEIPVEKIIKKTSSSKSSPRGFKK